MCLCGPMKYIVGLCVSIVLYTQISMLVCGHMASA